VCRPSIPFILFSCSPANFVVRDLAIVPPPAPTSPLFITCYNNPPWKYIKYHSHLSSRFLSYHTMFFSVTHISTARPPSLAVQKPVHICHENSLYEISEQVLVISNANARGKVSLLYKIADRHDVCVNFNSLYSLCLNQPLNKAIK